MMAEPQHHRLPAGRRISLETCNPSDTGGFGSKEEVKAEMDSLRERLEELQERLAARQERAVLFVFQGMDCSGKDGVIKQVFGRLNPQGFRAHSFKTPTREESSHDFLWRAHKLVPARGQLAAFNRSYYEDVLITRVHGTVSDEEAQLKFRHINHFERMLEDNGVRVVKIFLHISRRFQLEKLIDRIENPDKNWKFDPNDLVERKSWPLYRRCYEDVFEHCNTEEAPWYAVPSDRRWYRDYAVLRIVVDTLERMGLQKPEPQPGLRPLLLDLYAERDER